MNGPEIAENEIAGELRRLLRLVADADLWKIARSSRLHFSSNKVLISFSSINTNRYEIIMLTRHRALVITKGAQQIPNTAKLIINLINKFLVGRTGVDFVSLEKLLDENVANSEFLSAFLSALGWRQGLYEHAL